MPLGSSMMKLRPLYSSRVLLISGKYEFDEFTTCGFNFTELLMALERALLISPSEWRPLSLC